MAGADYITDVQYTGHFYAHLAPMWLNYIAAINGARPRPAAQEFTYCELGCGKGVTAAQLADLYPRGRFYAVDMNPEHIRHAAGLAEAGGLANLTPLAKSFVELPAMDLPQFDFIALHGVWSWVPEAVRAEILEVLRRKLKPGGLVMVSYNAMPGWAHILPLREMMQAYIGALEGDSLARARAALGYLKFLADNNADYFAANPAAAAHVADLLKQDLRYVAHEYVTRHGEAFYFSQVEKAMAGIGLAYAGNLMTELNYAQLMARAPFQKLLAGAPSRSIFETHRDFIANTRFRNDLYAAQPAPRPDPAQTPELLAGNRFALTQVPERIELKGREGQLAFDLTPEEGRVKAILAFLASGPATAAQIHEALGAAQPLAETVRFLMNLVVVGRIAPCAAQEPPPPGWSRLNRALLGQALRSGESTMYAGCPALGNALELPIAYAVSIQLANDCGSAGEAGEAGAAMLAGAERSLGLPDGKGGQHAASVPELREYFAAAWRAMREPASPEARHVRLLGLLPA